MKAVARRAGVSLMTVSYTFNEPDRVAPSTRERVLAAARELGYQGKNPWASALRDGRAGALGVVFSEHLTYAFTDPQANEFLAGVASVSAEHGLALTLLPTVGAPADAERVAEAPVDGYVFWTTRDDDPCLAAAVRTLRPCAIQGGPAYEGMVTVGVPDREAAAAVAAAALAGGARAPVVLTFPLDPARRPWSGYGYDLDAARYPVSRERLRGYRDALARAGTAWDRVLVVAVEENRRDHAERAMTQVLAGGAPVDLVLCASDELALGALAALRAHGVAVPERVAVTGWDDGPQAEAAGLTTVRQSLRAQGRACGLVAAGLATAPPPAAWRIVVRASTRSATGAARS